MPSQAQKQFSAAEAKVAMIHRKTTVTAIAKEIHVARETVSRAIHQGHFPKVRVQIARLLGLPSS